MVGIATQFSALRLLLEKPSAAVVELPSPDVASPAA
jgi:hypothetical protein